MSVTYKTPSFTLDNKNRLNSVYTTVFTTSSNINDIHSAMHDPTGFPNRTSSTWSFSGSELTIAPVSTSFDIWFNGIKHTILDTKKIVITDVEGEHLIYFDTDDTLKEYVNPDAGDLLVAIRDRCLVSIIYWDAANKQAVYIGEERHGTVMDGITHYYLHYTRGLQYVSGLGLGNFTINTGAAGTVVDANAQFSVEGGSVADEDIGLTISPIASSTGLPILYRDGVNGNWRTVSVSGFSMYPNPAGATNRLMYNQLNAGTWGLTEVDEGDFVLCHIFASTGKNNQIYAIIGQQQYTTAALARVGVQEEIGSLLIGNLPSPEIRPIASVIFETDKDFPNTIHARVTEAVVGGDDYVDWRSNDLPRGSVPGDHGSLTGLSDNDHPQYALATVLSNYALLSTYASTSGVYTTVQDNSGSWGGGGVVDLGEIPALSGNWNSVYTTVNTSSGSWGGSIDPVITTLSPDASVYTDLETGDIFTVTLTANTVLMNPTNPTNGKGYTWYIKQDDVGSRTVTLDSKFKIPSSATIPLAWSTTANAMDMFAVRADTDTDKFYVISMIPGY